MIISEHKCLMGITNPPTKTYQNRFVTFWVIACTWVTQLSESSRVLSLENSFSKGSVVLAQAICLPKFTKIGWELFELLRAQGHNYLNPAEFWVWKTHFRKEPSLWHMQFTCQNLLKSVGNFLRYRAHKNVAEKKRKKRRKSVWKHTAIPIGSLIINTNLGSN